MYTYIYIYTYIYMYIYIWVHETAHMYTNARHLEFILVMDHLPFFSACFFFIFLLWFMEVP